jgi:hypothetical protein
LTHINVRRDCTGILARVDEGQAMRREKTSAFAAAIHAALVCAAVAIPTAAQAKGHCPGGQHWQCTTYATSQENGAWYDAKTGQWYNKSCSCQGGGGSSGGDVGSYGHAEIHKKNVPTVKPSGVGPGNLAGSSLRLAPRAPVRVAPSATFRPAPTF